MKIEDVMERSFVPMIVVDVVRVDECGSYKVVVQIYKGYFFERFKDNSGAESKILRRNLSLGVEVVQCIIDKLLKLCVSLWLWDRFRIVDHDRH